MSLSQIASAFSKFFVNLELLYCLDHYRQQFIQAFPMVNSCITRVEHLGGKGLVQLGLSVIIAVKRPKTSPNELIISI